MKKNGKYLLYIVISSCVFLVLPVDNASMIPSKDWDWSSSSATAPYSWSYEPTYERLDTLLSTNSCAPIENDTNNPSFAVTIDKMADNIALQIIMFGGLPSDESDQLDNIVVVWSAYTSHAVGRNATLNLTASMGLVLSDANGLVIWSSDSTTASRQYSVSSMNLTCGGNLVLLNHSGGVVWQSFDHPTDTWLYRQTLDIGQTLTAWSSTNNLSAGNWYVSLGDDAAHAFYNSNNPTLPIEYGFVKYSDDSNYADFEVNNSKVTFAGVDEILDFAYVRLNPGGNLTLYLYKPSFLDSGRHGELAFGDLLTVNYGYPTTCGSYGVRVNDTVCQCPADANARNSSYFKQVFSQRPELGCSPVTPLACPDTHKLQTFTELENVTYFGFDTFLAGVLDVHSCKAACLQNCSCKAAVFHYGQDMLSGNCSLPTELLTMTHMDTIQDYNSSVFIKVQKPAANSLPVQMPTKDENANSSLVTKLASAISVSLFIVLCIGVGYYVMVLRKKSEPEETEGSSDVVIDTVARFSFESLKLATQDFQNKLGRGGFGSVFEGTLVDGTKVAVKRLESVGQGRKEFLAEVNTIGTLHHYNLVKLIGYCDHGLNRLLVYEFMPNGSLDKWIFNNDHAETLTWVLRQRIIGGIAKGLEYLHENCLQTVIHFDIKPQNILLSRDFNVKIADFGLAKMVDRDQTQVMTIIRGTPGYMAPELTTSQVISAKVDVYSFGVMVLEIVCGRKNFGSSEGNLLINLVKEKADEDRLSDLIDQRIADMQQHKEEAVKMMKIAICCLQPHSIRPNMSMVVKVLQDLPKMDALGDLSYLTMVHEATPKETNAFSTRPSESLLSGPR